MFQEEYKNRFQWVADIYENRIEIHWGDARMKLNPKIVEMGNISKFVVVQRYDDTYNWGILAVKKDGSYSEVICTYHPLSGGVNNSENKMALAQLRKWARECAKLL